MSFVSVRSMTRIDIRKRPHWLEDEAKMKVEELRTQRTDNIRCFVYLIAMIYISSSIVSVKFRLSNVAQHLRISTNIVAEGM